MPTFKVEFRVKSPHQTRDVDADSRDQAIATVVQEESANGEVSISRAVEVLESGTEAEPEAQPA
jgi:hypothetical protein